MPFRDHSNRGDSPHRVVTRQPLLGVVSPLRSGEAHCDPSPAFPATAFPIVMLCRHVTAATEVLTAVEHRDAAHGSAVVVGIIDGAAEIQTAYCTCQAFQSSATCPHMWVASYVLASQGKAR